ncbi:hypothetical protein TrCOL_g7094 [Triparma columacea]|uniref:Tyrosine specific protein phosphatases domain-containing protein n=1 Tax=Triparma columacea TaxID=722753 RepID=A0A9W7LBQ2_9STRA|nr:hypothetical protein TrCOL_g7094 [Triparma columacea]
MGAVHGCHMKYVALSLISLLALPMTCTPHPSPLFSSFPYNPTTPLAAVLWYSAVLNMVIAIGFKLRVGCELLMKDQKAGTIPALSYLLFFPFHVPTFLYTYIHTVLGVSHGVNYADEVLPNFWVGGRYAHKIPAGQSPPSQWEVTVDLTSEFPELSIGSTKVYVSAPVWDGTPPHIDDIDRCASAIADGWSGSDGNKGKAGGAVMVHCAHGRGRSCLIACAGIVKSGKAKSWREAFEMVKEGRKVCKLNAGMRDALERWEKKYMQ